MYYKREIDSEIGRAFEKWRVVLLFGARQIGKTTMADHYFETVVGQKKKLFGQNRDTQELLGSCSLAKIKALIGDTTFVFIDEAQYIPEIGTVLKLIYDALPHVSVLATGSSSFGLAAKTSEAMTGRKISLSVFPLSVREMTTSALFEVGSPDIESLLLYGSYPKILSTVENQDKEEILLELTESYLYKDVLEFHGIRKAPMIAKLAQMLALQIGNQVSFNELAQSLEINKATVQNYIDVLIKSFIIFPLPSLSRNPRKELHKSMKYYFYDNGIRNAIIRNFSDMGLRTDVGALWENLVVSEMYKRYTYDKKAFSMYHWRTYDQKEIDLIIEENGILTAFECKYTPSKSLNGATERMWKDMYPTAPVEIINRDTFWDLVK